ncbi:MAG: type II toxin-antitoxin system PemK/MazF family toxin [Nitrospira sp.]|nr:type II toxin-antitoxin system PemK/MazF family toxin [Nitrospira sp.]
MAQPLTGDGDGRGWACVDCASINVLFNPQAGHEQTGHRPTLVLSPARYNRLSEFMFCCPMTNRKKGYPFEVIVTDTPNRESVVLADQVKSLDWKVRTLSRKEWRRAMSL